MGLPQFRISVWAIQSFDTIPVVDKTLVSLFPDPEPLLQLSPEEIAWIILEIVSSWNASRQFQTLNHYNFTSLEVAPYTRLRQEVMDVLAEGWAWLQRECLLVPHPGGSANFMISVAKQSRSAQERN